MIVGRRRASIVLPTPGGPTSSEWWAPAAATASARTGLVEPAHVGEVERLVELVGAAACRWGIRKFGPRHLALQARVQLAEDAGHAHVRAGYQARLPRRCRRARSTLLDARR